MRSAPGVRIATVVTVAALAGLASWVLLQLWRNSGRELPELPWLGLAPMVLLSAVVLVAGWQVRRYARAGSRELAARRRVPPQRARGTLVAAQASALGGGALLGWYLANALVHLPNADVSSVRSLMVRALASAGAAALLAASGLVAQAMCRLPEDGEDDDDPPPELELPHLID